jgi:hypothetical protein
VGDKAETARAVLPSEVGKGGAGRRPVKGGRSKAARLAGRQRRERACARRRPAEGGTAATRACRRPAETRDGPRGRRPAVGGGGCCVVSNEQNHQAPAVEGRGSQGGGGDAAREEEEEYADREEEEGRRRWAAAAAEIKGRGGRTWRDAPPPQGSDHRSSRAVARSSPGSFAVPRGGCNSAQYRGSCLCIEDKGCRCSECRSGIEINFRFQC